MGGSSLLDWIGTPHSDNNLSDGRIMACSIALTTARVLLISTLLICVTETTIVESSADYDVPEFIMAQPKDTIEPKQGIGTHESSLSETSFVNWNSTEFQYNDTDTLQKSHTVKTSSKQCTLHKTCDKAAAHQEAAVSD